MIFKKQKKGMILIFTLGLMFCFVIMPLLFVRIESKRTQFKAKIGEMQFNTLGMYQEVDGILFYIDESGRYASHQAIFDLGLKGGNIEVCETYQGYSLWVNDNTECYPEAKKALPVFVEKYFNEYLAAHPNLPANDYDFFVKQENKLNVIGVAAINLDFDHRYQFYKSKYSIKPSFKAVIDYNINDYEILKQASKDMVAHVRACEKDKGFGPCVTEAKSIANTQIRANDMEFVAASECRAPEVSGESRIYGFCAKSSKEVIAYDSIQTRTEFYPVVIKFAIKFPRTSTATI